MLFGCLWISLKIIFEVCDGDAFNTASSLVYKWQWQSLLLPSDCDGVCFSKDSDVYYKWQ